VFARLARTVSAFDEGFNMTQPCHSYRRVIAIAAGSLMSLVAGCATTPTAPTDVVTTGMSNPEIALRDSMRLVDAEMTTLGMLNTPGPTRMAETIVPGELQKTVTFAFAGPLDDGVRQLAETVGYTVTITPPPPPLPGTAPLPPLTVNVTTGFVTAVSAFSALGDAAGTRALVRVDPQRHLVEVIHHA
jgi:defect-in-organelle-trafficking protein DotD